MTTSIVPPLNREASTAADNAFYARHPEMVKNGKRQPIDAHDPAHAGLREEWRQSYAQAGGNTRPARHTEAATRKEEARHADDSAKRNFSPVPAGKPVAPCARQAAAGSGAGAAGGQSKGANGPAPVAASSKPCTEGGKRCKVNKVTVKCGHGGRGGKLGPGNRLQVVPDDEYAQDQISLVADVATCGKVVNWVVSGAAEGKAATNSHTLAVKGWPYRAGLGLTPLSRWAARAVPNTYRVRASLDCGSLNDSYTIEAFPSDKIKSKIEPSEQPVFKAFRDYVLNGFLKPFFGKKLEVDFLTGSLSLEAYWKEDDGSWEAFYAYDIILGFNPLLKVKALISVLDAVGAMVSIPPSAVSWLQKYVGDALYVAAFGQITADGRLTRSAPDVFLNWYFQLGGGLGFELGLDIKGGSPKLLKATVKGATGLSATAQIGPKEKEKSPYVRLDVKFDGLKGSVEIEVASGWYKFEEEYALVAEKVLMSNHQASIFSES